MDSVEFNVQLAPFAINAISKRKLPFQTPRSSIYNSQYYY